MTNRLPLDTPSEVLDLARQIQQHLGDVDSGGAYNVSITRYSVTLQGKGWPDGNPAPTHGGSTHDRVTVEAGGAFFVHERERRTK